MITLLLLLILHSNLAFSSAQSQAWMRSGYWFSGSEFPASDINSGLFTHLICAFADINSSTYELIIPASDQQSFSAFSTTVKQKNPSVVTLLSIGGGSSNHTVFSTMVSQPSYRKSLIDSSITRARAYRFEGLDFSWPSAETESDANNMGSLFREWRAAIDSEARNNSSQSKLILTMAAPYSQYIGEATLPIELIRTNLDWVHVSAYDYYTPTANREKTGPSAALYDPQSNQNTDFGITSWINGGLQAEKIVLGLPFYGYAWTLKDPKDNAVGAPANGSAFTPDGDMDYQAIQGYIRQNNAVPSYNSTYVMSYFSVGTVWIGFDDVQVVKAKVSYARQKNLRGYVAWEVSYDANWELSQAAAEQNETKSEKSNQHILLKTLPPVAAVTILLLGYIFWRMRRRLFTKKVKESRETEDRPLSSMECTQSDESYFAHAFSFEEIKAATNDFSSENKLGEGGYGPVYKGTLQNGQEIAVKRLSETSKQGIEEFKTEVLLTSRLQHINLVRVLGYCTEREEKMLIYEYMPNNSLDFYIYDPMNRFFLNWEKRVQIIEGVTQGMLYLQEYSRLTVIHRDLKASNILLDNQMKPKISDFGMARMFQKDKLEANTDRVVGTYGYIPPEYVRGGTYSTKSDVFSFGVLLLQIISGKKITSFYGLHSNLTLLDYAYELWTNDKGREFLEETLDDATSSCKLMTCFQIALQCVQEDPNDRPSMLEVSYMLRNETTALRHPKRPAFSIRVEGEKSSTSSSAGMMDTRTITEVVAR